MDHGLDPEELVYMIRALESGDEGSVNPLLSESMIQSTINSFDAYVSPSSDAPRATDKAAHAMLAVSC